MNMADLMNTPRLYTALAEWAACLIYILILKKRHSRQKTGVLLGAAFVIQLLYQFIAGTLPLWLWIPGMVGALMLMYITIYAISDVSFADAGFCCVRAFVLAELVASLQWQLYVWFSLYYQKRNILISFLIMAVVYSFSFLAYWYLEHQHIPSDERLNVTSRELFGALITAIGVFVMSNLSFVMPNTPFSSAASSLLYVRTLVDFGGITMLFAQQDKREEFRMRTENESMNTVLQRQYDQFRVAQDNMELLRREFHDLKHYMIALRSETDPEKRAHYLTEMEHAIQLQEAFANTGNHVLDVVLTTKSTYCTQKNITLNCMADGTLLNFLHVKDICSIFGNALDNAIECVQQFDDLEKRLVTLSISRKNHFIIIRCENYTENSLPANGILPKTTKSNTSFHGYGLKSIQAAVQKYNGSMTLHSENNWFTLQLLLPLPQER